MEEYINEQLDIFGVNEFIKSSTKYLDTDIFCRYSLKDIFDMLLTGKIGNIFSLSYFKELVLTEISNSIKIISLIFVIVIIHSIFKALTENLNSSSISRVLYFVQYLMIVTILISTLLNMFDVVIDAIDRILEFMTLLIPLFISLVITTGNYVTSSFVEPLLLFVINFIGNFVSNYLIPLLMVTLCIYVISNVSDFIKIEKIASFFKSSIIWILGILLTFFTSLLSIEGSLSSTVDGVTTKTTKAAMQNFIPVVGKIMGDSVDAIMGCSNILKNSVGIFGVLVVAGISLLPVIKISSLYLTLKLTTACGSTIADEKIVRLVDKVADIYKILLAILMSVSIMFVIGITVVIKITNSSMMYR